MRRDIVILRNRKGRPGVGRKLARHFDCNEVTAGRRPELAVLDGSVVLGFGVGREPVWAAEARSRGVRFINTSEAVKTSVDKIAAFTAIDSRGLPTLVWMEDRQTAQDLVDEGLKIVVRDTAIGRQGQGIGLVGIGVEDGDHTGVVPEAPLYTVHYDKTHEFRVFVVNGKAVALTQKKRMSKKKREERGIEVNNLVRSHRNGWIFAHNNLACDVAGATFIKQLGEEAAAAVGLGLTGIDILAKIDDGGVLWDAVVCETNSSPGMSSPRTFKLITDAITEEYLDR